LSKRLVNYFYFYLSKKEFKHLITCTFTQVFDSGDYYNTSKLGGNEGYKSKGYKHPNIHLPQMLADFTYLFILT